MSGFKKWLDGEVTAFTKVMREYGAVKNDGQQSYTITDGDFKLEVKFNKVKGFDERADLAAERLVDYLKRYMAASEKGVEDPMYQMAMTLLERNKTGDLDYKSISKLYELEDKEKVLELAKRMAKYSNRVVVHMVPFTKIQEEIAHYCHDNMRIPIMRRIMVRIAEEIARKRDCLAIFTGDNLGQVASQTMESIYAINSVANMPILRPCITMEKEEIIRLAQQIDTYETSILPYEDCCTVFVPKDPKTKPKIETCEKEEAKLDIPALVAAAVENTERIIMYGKDKPERRSHQDMEAEALAEQAGDK